MPSPNIDDPAVYICPPPYFQNSTVSVSRGNQSGRGNDPTMCWVMFLSRLECVVPEVKVPFIFSVEVLIQSHYVVTIQSLYI